MDAKIRVRMTNLAQDAANFLIGVDVALPIDMELML